MGISKKYLKVRDREAIHPLLLGAAHEKRNTTGASGLGGDEKDTSSYRRGTQKW